MWGGSEAQWWGSLLPRLHAFLPAGKILEIGPGHGRWTRYLKEHCAELILVDLVESCIEVCRQRFADQRHITYQVSDDSSLSAVPDHSIDLAFSFDSLVHAEADVIEAYVRELARTLKPDGIGFIHHSNMGALRGQAALARVVPSALRRPLTHKGIIVNLYACRAESVTAELFAHSCEFTGLACIGQEKISWEYGRYLLDVISMCTPRGSRWERPNVVAENPRFMEEAESIAQSAAIYSTQSFGGMTPPA
jgi:ubiquinone/menaquinone biosynthesis C-methylase UbiE